VAEEANLLKDQKLVAVGLKLKCNSIVIDVLVYMQIICFPLTGRYLFEFMFYYYSLPLSATLNLYIFSFAPLFN
jgi:hypothetical protein